MSRMNGPTTTTTQKLLLFLVPALIVVQIAAFVFLHFANRRIALDSVDAALEGGAQTFQFTSATRREYLRLTSELTAKDYGLQSAMNENRATVESVLANHLERTGAEIIVLTDLGTRLLGRASLLPQLQDDDPAMDRLLEHITSQIGDNSLFLRPVDIGTGVQPLYNWIKVTVRAPLPVAHIYLAYRVSQTAVERFAAMTQLQMAFVSHNDDGTEIPHASTLPDGILSKAVLHSEESHDSFTVVTSDGDPYRIKILPLGGARDHHVDAVVAKPFAPVLSPFLKLEGLFAASIIFSSFITILAANAITSRVVTPLEAVAQKDALTGLANRRLLEVNMGNAEQNQKALGMGFTLMLMDLNKFKQVNDTYGHEAGDIVLKEVALRVRKLMRAPDTLARLGGDEFAILLRTQDRQRVVGLATEIASVVKAPIQIQDGQWVEVGASIGIGLSPDHSTFASEVLHHADLAMYIAKKQGGGYSIAPLPSEAEETTGPVPT